MQRTMDKAAAHGEAQLWNVLKREEETVLQVGKKVEQVADILDRAADKSRRAHHRELRAKESLDHSVHILGHYQKTQRNYNTVVDNKLSSILNGCLHHVDQECHGRPSPRNLPPPMAPHLPVC